MPAPAADRFSLSDLQLASGIAESENTASAFYKNSYEITPNPSMVFGESLPVIFFYSEIYNTRRSLNSEVLRVDHLLINAANAAVVQKTKYTSRKNDNIVEAGSLNIRKVPTGAYTLRVSVMDTTSKLTVVSSKKLFVFNPGIVDTSRYEAKEGDVLASEFIAYSEQELDDAFEQAKYIARKDEIDTWKKLKDAEAKRQFLYTFWKGRNALAVEDDTRTSKQYYQRVKQANDRFSTIRRQGWRTDRGRVYLIFGEPSEIERYPNEIDSKPYEIWRYNNLEGGVVFVFGDVSGFSEYQLLHSTMRGELRDENWERKVRQM
jgi:GWxTD domain-containing protein